MQNKDSGLYRILNEKLSLTAGFYFAVTFAATILFLIAFKLGQPWIALAIVAAIPLVIVWIRFPRSWIYSTALFAVVFMRDSNGGISAMDVITAVLYVVSLVLWFIWIIFVKRQKLVKNLADWMILFFFLVLPLNLIVALVNGTGILSWLREYTLFTVLLYYYPIRYYFNDKKSMLRLLMTYLLVSAVIITVQLYQYKTGILANAVYAYEIEGAIKLSQCLFSAGSIFSIAFALYVKKRWQSLTLSLFAFASLTALIFTFSRTFWIVMLLNLVLIFFYVSNKQKKRFLLYLSVITGIFFSILIMVFRQNTGVILKVIENRLVSSTKGRKDISVLSRLAEYKVVISYIERHPIGGNGFGYDFHFYNPLAQETKYTNFVHNGYLYLPFRIGIPLSIVYFFVVFYYLRRSEYLARHHFDDFSRTLALSSFLTLVMLIISNFAAEFIISREALVINSLIFAFIGYCDQNHKKNMTINSIA